jgi:hypothetical protein
LNTHEQYEELCALAASGQASQDELADLRSHLEVCPSCRGMTYDFTQISAQGLSQLAAKHLRCQIPSGMTQRFLARARSEGIELTRERVPPAQAANHRWQLATIGVAAAALLVAGFLIVARQKSSTAALDHRPLSANRPSASSPISVVTQSGGADVARLQQQLAATRSEMKFMSATIEEQRAEIESGRKASDDLTSRLTEAEKGSSITESERSQRDARIAQLEGEIEKAKSEKNASDTALALQESGLRELRKQVSDQATALAEEQQLAEKGSDVRDLVVARNLHIIDVHDRDGDGKSQRAFGRIFYTEGKSLIFYAYDLADPRKLDAKVSFYVWGERLGAEKPIRSLGIFHNDDPKDGRWVLTFDDPQVLAQINSVFVTVESSKKAIREPGGRRVLFAFLGDKPNHP